MSLLYRWNSDRAALCVAALAYLASLTLGHAVTRAVDGNWTTGTGSGMHARVSITGEFLVFFGCLDPTKQYSYQFGPSGGNVNIPAGSVTFQSTHALAHLSSVFDGGAQYNPLTAGTRNINYTQNFGVTLFQSGNQVDYQAVPVSVTGSFTYQSGAARVDWPLEPVSLVFSLKPGGPASGKTRIGQVVEETPEFDEGEEIELMYDAPDYYIDPETGGVLPMAPPSFSIGPLTEQVKPGIGWYKLQVPSGTVSGNTVPGTISAMFPNAVKVNGPDGRNIYFGSTVRSGGQPVSVDAANVTISGNGSSHLSTYAGDFSGKNYTFPQEYTPLQRSAVGTPPPPPSSENVDPCFGHALDLLGVLPPGVTPDPGGPPELPPGVTPGNQLPAIPGLSLPGSATLPPGVTKGIPSAGSGGGTGGAPRSTSPGGGGSGSMPGVSLPSGPAPEGQAAAAPGGPLPGEDAGDVKAREYSEDMKDALGKVQEKAKDFFGWSKVEPFSTGQESEWVVQFTAMGRTYSMTIPTHHASTIRALLLILLKVAFIAAIIKLLLS